MSILAFSAESLRLKSSNSNVTSASDDSNLNRVFRSSSVSPHFIPIKTVYTKDSDGTRV